MDEIEPLAKYDLAIKGKTKDGDDGFFVLPMDKTFVKMIDYGKLTDKLNQLIEAINRLQTAEEKSEN